MLLSAVKQASDSVFVDLLTYQDLEVLKQRKAGASAQHAAANRPMVPNTKRYLILTYAAEFDRVHYPLPLLYEEHPDPQRLKDIIAQLRSEVDALSMDQMGSQKRTSGMSGEQAVELRRMREENQALRQQLKQLDRAVKADLPDNDRATAEFRELSRELKAVSVGCSLVLLSSLAVAATCRFPLLRQHAVIGVARSGHCLSQSLWHRVRPMRCRCGRSGTCWQLASKGWRLNLSASAGCSGAN